MSSLDVSIRVELAFYFAVPISDAEVFLHITHRRRHLSSLIVVAGIRNSWPTPKGCPGITIPFASNALLALPNALIVVLLRNYGNTSAYAKVRSTHKSERKSRCRNKKRNSAHTAWFDTSITHLFVRGCLSAKLGQVTMNTCNFALELNC